MSQHTPKKWQYLVFPSQTETLRYEDYNHAVTCVNACRDMADPANEIQAMREALKEIADFWCEKNPNNYERHAKNECPKSEKSPADYCPSCLARHTLGTLGGGK